MKQNVMSPYLYAIEPSYFWNWSPPPKIVAQMAKFWKVNVVYQITENLNYNLNIVFRFWDTVTKRVFFFHKNLSQVSDWKELQPNSEDCLTHMPCWNFSILGAPQVKKVGQNFQKLGEVCGTPNYENFNSEFELFK